MKKVVEVTEQKQEAEYQAQQVKFWEKIIQDQKKKIKEQTLKIDGWEWEKDD